MWLIFALIIFGWIYDWLTTLWIFRWFYPPTPLVPKLHLETQLSPQLYCPPQPRSATSQTPSFPSATWEREERNDQPVTFFRPIKRGVPYLDVKLQDFLTSVNEDDQVLFGVYDDDVISQQIIRKILAAFPSLDATLIECQSGLVPNPKVNKLIQLAPLAKHEHWIVMDSEMESCGDFLTSFRAEWAVRQFPVMSASYRFRKLTVDTLPVLSTLLPGLAVLQRTHNVRLTLGACVALTRSQMRALGNWETFGNYLAEDYQIGHQAASLAIPVVLSSTVASLDNDSPITNHLSLRTSHALPTLLHLHRAAITYRVCQPWGFAASLCNHTPFWCLLLIGRVEASIVIGLLAFTFLSRILAVWFRAGFVHWRIEFPRLVFLSFASAILETIFWFLSWLPLPVWWAGRFWKIKNGVQLH